MWKPRVLSFGRWLFHLPCMFTSTLCVGYSSVTVLDAVEERKPTFNFGRESLEAKTTMSLAWISICCFPSVVNVNRLQKDRAEQQQLRKCPHCCWVEVCPWSGASETWGQSVVCAHARLVQMCSILKSMLSKAEVALASCRSRCGTLS